ncbi:protein serine threonine phosphatase 2C [Roridomyces roridus]|uniref:Protein serine threonine phosphatase 2C n=1 Tax=Roridomyces roridus TaxID=1738132 RepID=A0AAD7FWR6_9AGAR|nr:protein serine threonine phosphatase 2C [Roridomyces roridus]
MSNQKENRWGQLYTPIQNSEELSQLLDHLANAETIGATDAVTFQPCKSDISQDRFFVEEWDKGWKFLAVVRRHRCSGDALKDLQCDGHAGHETVTHVVATLPGLVRDALKDNDADPGSILCAAIEQIDARIGQDLLELFPDGPAALSDDEIDTLINDDGPNSAKVLRCMRGSTVLAALIGPDHDLWVASLGDCQAVLGFKAPSGQWESQILSSNHNGANETEAARVQSEHPGEPETILRERVLGAIAVTRAVGDFLFKLPSVYTTRVFMNAKPGFQFSSKIADFLGRNLTPPYLSAKCDLQHVHLPSLGSSEPPFLVLASDGLIDLSCDTYGYDHRDLTLMAKKWTQVLARQERTGNGALYLLRDAMGQDEDSVSAWLTVESDSKWMDDITVLFTPLL